MAIVRGLASVLALIGRFGTQGFIISLFVGLALPALAAGARPFLGVSIFVFVMMTFTRVNLQALHELIRRPALLLLTCVCLLVVPVLVVGSVVAAVGRDALGPGLLLGLAILAAAPPMMSAPAVAMLLRIEPALIMASVILLTILSPILSPLIVNLVVGAAVPLGIVALIGRLLWMIGGAMIAAAVLRRLLGQKCIAIYKSSFDGIGVIMYFVFAVAAMDGVLAATRTDPGHVARLLGTAIGLGLAGAALTWLVLRRIPPAQRLMLAYATGQRNMGLLIAALGAGTPKTTFLFFALAQFPVYFGPHIVKHYARRLAPQSVA